MGRRSCWGLLADSAQRSTHRASPIPISDVKQTLCSSTSSLDDSVLPFSANFLSFLFPSGHFTKNFCIVLLVFKIFIREGHRFYYSCSTTKFLVLSRSRTLVCGPSRFCFSVGGPSASLKLGKKGGNQGILYFTKHLQFPFHQFPGRRGNPEQVQSCSARVPTALFQHLPKDVPN